MAAVRNKLFFILLLTSCGSSPHDAPPVETATLTSDHYEGFAAFAAQHDSFPCSALIDAAIALPAPALTFPFHTFGTASDCVARFVAASADKPHLLQIYATNETCRKHNSCTTGDLFHGVSSAELNRRLEDHEPTTIATFDQRFSDISQFISSVTSKNTRTVVSLGLEDEYTTEAAGIVYDLAAAHFKEISENPEHPRGTISPVIELHRDQPVAEGGIANEDGICRTDAQSKDFLRRNKHTLATFLWRPEWQGRRCKDGKVVGANKAPRDRSFGFDSSVSGLFD